MHEDSVDKREFLADGSENVTAWGRQLIKYYPTEKHVQSTLSYTGASKGSTGGITVWLFYVRLA